MKPSFPLLLWPAVLTMCVVLISCGGGGGGGSSSTTSSASSSSNSTFSSTKTQVMSYQNADNVIQVFNTQVADLNGDGLEDVVVSGWAQESTTWSGTVHGKVPLKILIQQTDGTLVDKTTSLLGTNNMIYGSQRVIIQDFDGDGKPDIFVGGFQDSPGVTNGHCCDPTPSAIFWNEGTSFTRQDFTENVWAHSVCIGNLYGSSVPDIVIGYADQTNNRYNTIYKNNGNRSFTLVTSMPSVWLGGNACTILKDSTTGHIAIVNTNVGYAQVAGYSSVVNLFDSNMNFLSTAGLPSSEYSGSIYSPVHDQVNIVATDINGDGLTDLIITDNATDKNNGYLVALINTGSFSFSNQSSTYFPSQSNNASYMYYTRYFTVNNANTLFLCNADSSFNFTTLTDLYQKPSTYFQAFDQSTLSAAISGISSSAVFPTVYKASNGKLYVLAAVPSFSGNSASYIFYTNPL